MLAQIGRITAELLLLRRGPQDLPSDYRLLVGFGAVYCALAFVQVQLVASTGSAAAQAILATLLMAVYVRSILAWRGFPERFVQTLSALFAAGAVLTLLLLGPTAALAPTLQAMAHKQDAQATLPEPPPAVLLAYMAVGLWNLAVYGHVYRNALAVRYWLGIAAALGFELLLIVCFAILGA